MCGATIQGQQAQRFLVQLASRACLRCSVCKTGLYRKSDINRVIRIRYPRTMRDAQRDICGLAQQHGSDNKKATIEVACVCLTAGLLLSIVIAAAANHVSQRQQSKASKRKGSWFWDNRLETDIVYGDA